MWASADRDDGRGVPAAVASGDAAGGGHGRRRGGAASTSTGATCTWTMSRSTGRRRSHRRSCSGARTEDTAPGGRAGRRRHPRRGRHAGRGPCRAGRDRRGAGADDVVGRPRTGVRRAETVGAGCAELTRRGAAVSRSVGRSGRNLGTAHGSCPLVAERPFLHTDAGGEPHGHQPRDRCGRHRDRHEAVRLHRPGEQQGREGRPVAAHRGQARSDQGEHQCDGRDPAQGTGRRAGRHHRRHPADAAEPAPQRARRDHGLPAHPFGSHPAAGREQPQLRRGPQHDVGREELFPRAYRARLHGRLHPGDERPDRIHHGARRVLVRPQSRVRGRGP